MPGKLEMCIKWGHIVYSRELIWEEFEVWLTISSEVGPLMSWEDLGRCDVCVCV